MITKGSNEYDFWKELYMIRNKYTNEVHTEDQFKSVMREAAKLYDKYINTDAAIPARWGCAMIREMFNTEWMIEHSYNQLATS